MKESVGSINSRVSLPMGGATLSDLLVQQKRLAFSTVVDYLDQLSEAIDLAHERGHIHRNIKPSTILLTAEGRLRLTEDSHRRRSPRDSLPQGSPLRSTPLQRLQDEDSRLMTLAYMAPEQILAADILSPEARHLSGFAGMDRAVDGRADLYSLGVVLYQMVTGALPFQAETPEQVALKHLRMPPPSPRQLRPDLPVAAEQAMLRALAKRPVNRYMRAQDLATAFRVALIAADIQLDEHHDGTGTGTLPFIQRGLFDPARQTGGVPVVNDDLGEDQPTGSVPVVKATPSPSVGNPMTPAAPIFGATQETFSTAPTSPASPEPIPTTTDSEPAVVRPANNPISPFPATNTTGKLVSIYPSSDTSTSTASLPATTQGEGNTGTFKLTGPAKIVQVPVAGQPGRYVTGLLPVFPVGAGEGSSARRSVGPLADAHGGNLPVKTKGGRNKRMNMLMLAVMIMLVLSASGIFWFIHTHSSQTTRQGVMTTITPNVKATATAQAIATANANVILVDPLSQNIHNWPVATTGLMIYIFKDGAYHITDNDSRQGAPAILPDEILHGSFAYTLTMEEIKGDDTSVNNEFGMIIRANSQNKNGKLITTFYSFEVLNNKGGEYQFWKYDNSAGPNVSPWTKLWHHPFGKEFHQGQGSGSVNTFKIFVNGKSFTLIVNGKQITTVQDNSCNSCPCNCSGGVGMLVNLKGTEVAFSNLKLTYN